MYPLHRSRAHRLRSARILIGLLLSAASLSGVVSAAELKGRFTSDLYISETNDVTHVRAYERLRAEMVTWRGDRSGALSLHTYLRWRSDFANKRPDDPQWFVYDAYVRLKERPRGSEFDVGRQFVYNGAGSALMDGLRLRYRAGAGVNLDVFGGSAASRVDPEEVRSLSDYTVAGARINVTAGRMTRLGIGWMLRRDAGSMVFHRLSFDGRHELGRGAFYTRLGLNAQYMRVADVLARISYTPAEWYLSGEFGWREPSVSGNSVFSLLEFDRYKDIRLEAQRRVGNGVAVVTQGQASLYEDETAWRGSVGIRGSIGAISWNTQTGHRGKNNGLSGTLNVPLNRYWTGFASANVNRYRVQDEQEDLSDAYASSAGLLWRSGSGWMARGEVQYLRNAVATSDVRTLIRVTRSFSHRPESGQAGHR